MQNTNNEACLNIENILNEMSNILTAMSNMPTMTTTTKTPFNSCIKIKNCNLLPPIVSREPSTYRKQSYFLLNLRLTRNFEMKLLIIKEKPLKKNKVWRQKRRLMEF